MTYQEPATSNCLEDEQILFEWKYLDDSFFKQSLCSLMESR